MTNMMMKRMKSLLGIAVFAAIHLASMHGLQAQETAEAKEKRMQWFEDAKLGIFIHWGIYSVHGIDESWSFFNKYLPYKPICPVALKGIKNKVNRI